MWWSGGWVEALEVYDLCKFPLWAVWGMIVHIVGFLKKMYSYPCLSLPAPIICNNLCNLWSRYLITAPPPKKKGFRQLFLYGTATLLKVACILFKSKYNDLFVPVDLFSFFFFSALCRSPYCPIVFETYVGLLACTLSDSCRTWSFNFPTWTWHLCLRVLLGGARLLHLLIASPTFQQDASQKFS